MQAVSSQPIRLENRLGPPRIAMAVAVAVEAVGAVVVAAGAAVAAATGTAAVVTGIETEDTGRARPTPLTAPSSACLRR